MLVLWQWNLKKTESTLFTVEKLFCWHQYENKKLYKLIKNDSQTSFLPRQLNRPTSYWPRCRAPSVPLFSLRHVWGPVIWAAVSIHEPRQLVKWSREEGKWGENVWDRVRFVLLFQRISDHFLVQRVWAVKLFNVPCVTCCSAASIRDWCCCRLHLCLGEAASYYILTTRAVL